MSQTSERKPRGRRFWRRPLEVALSVTVVLALVGAGSVARWHSNRGTNPYIDSIRAALLDKIQPGSPFPIILDPLSSPDVVSLANASLAVQDFGLGDVGTGVAAALTQDLATLPLNDGGLGDIDGLWTVLRARIALSGGLLSAAEVDHVAAYLRARSFASSPPDGSALMRSALLARIGGLGSKSGAPAIAEAARGAILAELSAQCEAANSHLKQGSPAALGFAFEVEIFVKQSCLTEPQASRFSGDPMTSADKSADEADLLERAFLAGAAGSPLPEEAVPSLFAAASGLLKGIASRLESDQRRTCPMDTIRQAGDIELVLPIDERPELPPAIASCLTRGVRWLGMLPELQIDSAALSTFLEFQALSVLPGHSATDATLATLIDGISWNDSTLDASDYLTLALSFEKGRISSQIVDAVARSDVGRTPFGIVLLNAASSVLGYCPESAASATKAWLANSSKSGGDGFGSLWGIFAVGDARVCVTGDGVQLLASARASVVNSLSTLRAGASESEVALLSWLKVAAKCEGILDSGTPRPPKATASSLGDLLLNNGASTMNLFVDALTAAGDRCGDLGWLDVANT